MTLTPALEAPVPRVPVPPATLVWCAARDTWTLPRITSATTPVAATARPTSAFIAGLTDKD